MDSNSESPAFVVEFRGLKVQCSDVEHVVEVVKRILPLEREVAVPMRAEPPQTIAAQQLTIDGASPVATAVYDLFRAEPRWRRPVEIVKALKKRRVAGAKYTNVYAVLRYGDFVKREGRWNTKDAQAAL